MGPELFAAHHGDDPRNCGIMPPPADTGRASGEICDKYGIVKQICDEVMAGFLAEPATGLPRRSLAKLDPVTFAKARNSGYVPLGVAIS